MIFVFKKHSFVFLSEKIWHEPKDHPISVFNLWESHHLLRTVVSGLVELDFFSTYE